MSGLLPCPNPWCEASERAGDYSPQVRLHHFGNYRVVCTSCVFEGPLRATKEAAEEIWNTRKTDAPALVNALEGLVSSLSANDEDGLTEFAEPMIVARAALKDAGK